MGGEEEEEGDVMDHAISYLYWHAPGAFIIGIFVDTVHWHRTVFYTSLAHQHIENRINAH